jgi:drug/metabolite transporter (DMT)-like permease
MTDPAADTSSDALPESASGRFMLGFGVALFGACSYGFNIIFAQIASQSGIMGPTIFFYRVFLMVPIGLLILLASRTAFVIERSEWKAIIGMALASSGVGLCYISSVAYIPVTVAAVIFYTFPILVVMLSPIVERRRLTPDLVVIVVMAFIGVVIVVGPSLNQLDPLGLLLAAGASLSATMQFFFGTRSPKTHTIPKAIVMQLVMLPVAACIALSTTGLPSPAVLLLAPLAVALTIGGYAIGFLCQLLALSRISAVVGGLAFCLEPVVATLSAHVILDEVLTPLQYCGGLLVLAAIIINVIFERRRMRAGVQNDQTA